MANVYQRTITEAIEAFFLLRSTRKKSMDLPWMSKKIRKMITHCKRMFWEAGGERTEAWRDYREKVDKEILRRKKGYLAQQKMPIEMFTSMPVTSAALRSPRSLMSAAYYWENPIRKRPSAWQITSTGCHVSSIC